MNKISNESYLDKMISKEIVFSNHQKKAERPDSILKNFSPLNFNFMKQLILLVFLTGMVTTSVIAQPAVTGSAPKPITCSDDPLHPIAGKPYDYSAVLNPAGGTTYWYATKSTTFVTAGARTAVEILADGTSNPDRCNQLSHYGIKCYNPD